MPEAELRFKRVSCLILTTTAACVFVALFMHTVEIYNMDNDPTGPASSIFPPGNSYCLGLPLDESIKKWPQV